uniref:Uncharacterized protein n=1 Tax=Periophthalmus magnuspinnatus TaxID=409849 RepID=A0A3B3ZXE4_9GOBI
LEAGVLSPIPPSTNCCCYKPGGRLDMSHGFLHHIRRNQIARDDYDKEVKQAKELKRRRHTTVPRRPRRPDIQVYYPKCRDDSKADPGGEADDCSDSSGSHAEGEGPTELFWLDYQADCGSVTSVLVHKVRYSTTLKLLYCEEKCHI